MIQIICEDIKPHAIVTTQITGERQVTAEVLADLFKKNGASDVFVEAEVGKALKKALELQEDGMVFCVGSLYLIGEIKGLMENK